MIEKVADAGRGRPRLSKNSPVLSWKVVSRVHSLLAFSLFRGNKGDENFSPTPPHNQKLVRFPPAQQWASDDLPHPPSAAISITNQPRRRNCRLVWKARTVLGTPGGSRGPFHVPDHFEMLPNSLPLSRSSDHRVHGEGTSTQIWMTMSRTSSCPRSGSCHARYLGIKQLRC